MNNTVVFIEVTSEIRGFFKKKVVITGLKLAYNNPLATFKEMRGTEKQILSSFLSKMKEVKVISNSEILLSCPADEFSLLKSKVQDENWFFGVNSFNLFQHKELIETIIEDKIDTFPRGNHIYSERVFLTANLFQKLEEHFYSYLRYAKERVESLDRTIEELLAQNEKLIANNNELNSRFETSTKSPKLEETLVFDKRADGRGVKVKTRNRRTNLELCFAEFEKRNTILNDKIKEEVESLERNAASNGSTLKRQKSKELIAFMKVSTKKEVVNAVDKAKAISFWLSAEHRISYTPDYIKPYLK